VSHVNHEHSNPIRLRAIDNAITSETKSMKPNSFPPLEWSLRVSDRLPTT